MPENRDGHEDALKEAWNKASTVNISVLAANSGATLKTGTKQLVLKVLGEDCVVDFDNRTIKHSSQKAGDVKGHVKVLILHYILGSGNAQLANRFVSYREFEGGALYYSAFKARTIDVLVREFGHRPDLLRHIGDAIRAEPMNLGSASFKAHFFQKMPISVIVWAGDEEVPSSANLLFDANAGRILPTEDISVMGGVLCSMLVGLEKA